MTVGERDGDIVPRRERLAVHRHKGLLVAFVGIDGAGKTSLVGAVARELRVTGLDVRVAWCGFADWQVIPLGILRRSPSEEARVSDQPRRESKDKWERVLRNPFVRFGYYSVVSVDYSLQLVVKVGFPRLEGHIVLCDRYYYDQAVSYSVELNSPSAQRLFSGLYRLALPRPDMVFLVDVPPEVAVARKSDIPSLDYVERRRRKYTELARTSGFYVLDGTESAERNVEIVVDVLRERLGATSVRN